MQLTLNEETYELSDVGLSEVKDQLTTRFLSVYETLPLDSKIMAKGVVRAFLLYSRSKTQNPLFNNREGDPVLQFINILGDMLVEIVKDAEIHATIRNDTFNLISFQSESEGKSR
jgi:hypothetical protein